MTKPLERPVSADVQREPEPMRFTVAEYERIYSERPDAPRTELIDGVIYNMPPMGEEHAFSLRKLNTKLVLRYGTRAEVQQQSPLRLPDFSEPEPDFAMLRLNAPGIPLAEDVLWLIEISKTTYTHDRDKKLTDYAQHGIPEVWILNLNTNRLEVYRNPKNTVPGGWGYDPPTVFEPGQAAAPLAFPEDGLEWW